MERWTFLIIAGPDGEAIQVRIRLRAGDDPDAWPTAQIGIDGADAPVDAVAHDYEAPEWKVVQLIDGAGGQGQARVDAVKNRLRAAVAA